jgi:hypothetical protein
MKRYVHGYTIMYVHWLIDEYTGHIFIGFFYLCRFRYREIYLSYIIWYPGI